MILLDTNVVVAHLNGHAFTTVDQLLADFARDVERLRREEKP